MVSDHAKEYVVDMTGFENDGIIVLERCGSDNEQVAKWKCICKYCGTEFITRGSTIRNGDTRSCGCVHSYNERKIASLLLKNGIEFKREYTFPDLRGLGGKCLRFDFAILQNGRLSHLIEYNGKQHYMKVPGSWGDLYDTLATHDQMKKQYCEDNNIRLIILSYDQEYCIDDLL